jgi:23S rRNA (uracil1939-C5)-methyltransferase
VSLLTLDIEKATPGGRMLARHEGQVVLVSGAIPGERVRARVERRARGVLFARVEDVLAPSPDRRPVQGDWRCGGSDLAHVAYERQLRLKGDILRDAFARVGRLSLDTPPQVLGSPERGYRTRARLHVRDMRLGFYREGTRELCDASATGQFSAAAAAWIDEASRRRPADRRAGVEAVDNTESQSGDQRASHRELVPGREARAFAGLADGLVGLSASRADRPDVASVVGEAAVEDAIRLDEQAPALELRLRRRPRAFFQGNRFLVEPLVRRVVGLVPPGPVLDLYAGVGLFGLALATCGRGEVTAVEGDRVSGADLVRNARGLEGVRVERGSVEAFLDAGPRGLATVVLDPPRTGVSPAALAGLCRLLPPRIVYVSCDPATLARDARALVAAGYALASLEGLDLYPGTSHVEAIAVLVRREHGPARSGNPADPAGNLSGSSGNRQVTSYGPGVQ